MAILSFFIFQSFVSEDVIHVFQLNVWLNDLCIYFEYIARLVTFPKALNIRHGFSTINKVASIVMQSCELF